MASSVIVHLLEHLEQSTADLALLGGAEWGPDLMWQNAAGVFVWCGPPRRIPCQLPPGPERQDHLLGWRRGQGQRQPRWLCWARTQGAPPGRSEQTRSLPPTL